MSGCAAFVDSDQESHIYETVLLNLCGFIVNLLYFANMKTAQLLNILGVEPVLPGICVFPSFTFVSFLFSRYFRL